LNQQRIKQDQQRQTLEIAKKNHQSASNYDPKLKQAYLSETHFECVEEAQTLVVIDIEKEIFFSSHSQRWI